MLGYSKEELYRLSYEDITPEKGHRPEAQIIQNQVLQRGYSEVYEKEYVRKDGTIFPVELRTYLIPDDRVGCAGMWAFVRDISDRKSAEVAAGIEKLRFEALAENAPFGLVMIAEDGAFQYVNPKFRELFGYDAMDVPNGREWLKRAYPDSAYRRQVIRTWLEDAEKAKTGEPRPRTFTVTCKDGSHKTVHFVPVHLATGQHLMACEDVTERRNLEEERDRLFALSMDMLCVAGFDGFFKQLNPAWTKTLGWSVEELLSNPYIEFVHPDDREGTANAGKKLLSGESVHGYENRYECKGGSYRWISWNSFPLGDEKLIFAVARDITDRKNSEFFFRAVEQQSDELLPHPNPLWLHYRMMPKNMA